MFGVLFEELVGNGDLRVPQCEGKRFVIGWLQKGSTSYLNSPGDGPLFEKRT